MVMDAGEVISQGLIKDVLADPKVHAAYFETWRVRIGMNYMSKICLKLVARRPLSARC